MGCKIYASPNLAPGGMVPIGCRADVPGMLTRIKEWRKTRRMTQEKLGAAVGMSGGNISRLERGLIPYTQPTLEAIAVVLSVRPAQLLEGGDFDADHERLTEAYRRLPKTSRHQALRILTALADVNPAAE